jgi:cytochrome c553
MLLVAFILAYAPSGWANAARDAALFRFCAACHGSQGEGRLEVGAPAVAGLAEWYVTAQILKFRQGVRGSHPRDLTGMRMRPAARSLSSQADVQAVARYVASLPPQVSPPTVSGDIARGAAQYTLCVACHGADGGGNQQLMAPPLRRGSDWYLLRQLQNFQQARRGADPARDATGAMMMAIASTLDEQAMQDVIAYIQTLR